jgi:CheY-like chemotaxis protein
VSGEFARLVVKATGHGISPAFLPHVFERFRQSDASSTRRHGGLGLGLSLVRDLVDLHRGLVCAESAGEGQGATFTVDLPTEPIADVRTVATRRTDPGPRALATVRVLLIEDEADSRNLVRTALASCGAHVSAVATSAEAVSAILSSPPDSLPHVVVSDIGMPIEDG